MPVFMVTRTDNHTGAAFPADDAGEALSLARAHTLFQGATELTARLFAGHNAKGYDLSPATWRAADDSAENRASMSWDWTRGTRYNGPIATDGPMEGPASDAKSDDDVV